jgi:DHA2 family methylenomycin A resistance protein-like MFS transporter
MRSASARLPSVLQSETDARLPYRPETKSTPSKLASSLTLAAMSLGYGVVQLDVTIVNTALNAIGTSLGGEMSGWWPRNPSRW